MGIYYRFANATRKEWIDPEKLGDHCKMREIVWNSDRAPGGTGVVLAYLMMTRWFADDVTAVSDSSPEPWDWLLEPEQWEKRDELAAYWRIQPDLFYRDVTAEVQHEMGQEFNITYQLIEGNGRTYIKRERQDS